MSSLKEWSRNPAAGQGTSRKSFEGFQAHLLKFDWTEISEIGYEKQFVNEKYTDNGCMNVYRIYNFFKKNKTKQKPINKTGGEKTCTGFKNSEL